MNYTTLPETVVRLLVNDFEVAGSFGEGRALVSETVRWRPDVVIADVGMPLWNGIDRPDRFASPCRGPGWGFSLSTSEANSLRGVPLGASARVSKNVAGLELITAVREALAGRYFVSADFRETSLSREFLPEHALRACSANS